MERDRDADDRSGGNVGAFLCGVILLVGVSCGAPASEGSEASSSSQVEPRSVIVDGRSFSLQCAGTGSPTVILESGWRDGIAIWDAASGSVFDELSTRTRVCAYDRAGVSGSDPRGAPTYSPADVVSDLHALLTEAGIEPPYVLVGHSLAGLILPLFASEYPSEVDGMVLLDPSTLWQFEGRQYEDLLAEMGPLSEGGATLDVRAVRQQLAGATRIDVPLVVLTAGLWLESSLLGDEWFVADHERLVRATTSSAAHIIVPNVDHYIQLHVSPTALTNVITGVMSAAPDGSLPPCGALVRGTDWTCDGGNAG
jgi:pimeloyl-ACP methyl ester carboxylesterase